MAEMTLLRRRMIEDMKVRNLSPATRRCYVHAVAKFAEHFKRSPDRLGLAEIRAYHLDPSGRRLGGDGCPTGRGCRRLRRRALAAYAMRARCGHCSACAQEQGLLVDNGQAEGGSAAIVCERKSGRKAWQAGSCALWRVD
jgi:Phage integrase, N-terminal SAM-like domain